MNRVVSQLILTAPDQLLRHTVLEISENGLVSQLISLNDMKSETAATIFRDGIISAGIVSLKLRAYDFQQMPEQFLYIDITNIIPEKIDLQNRILILDAHTENPTEFSLHLHKALNSLSDINIADIIAATCYMPALLCNFNNEIRPGNSINAIIWENCNLPDKKLTSNVSIANLY